MYVYICMYIYVCICMYVCMYANSSFEKFLAQLTSDNDLDTPEAVYIVYGL